MENKTIFIVMVVHNQGETLEQNLPLFLEQAVAVGAKIIIVDDMSIDNTPDVLKRMTAKYGDMLHTTFLPRSVIINPSRMRLALTVGAKACKGEYVVLADIRRPPVSAEWLTGLADGEAALVYSNHKGDQATHVVANSLDELAPVVTLTERKLGRSHYGNWMKRRRGLYDAMGVRSDRVFDAINLFDQNIQGKKLMKLRLRVWFGQKSE